MNNGLGNWIKDNAWTLIITLVGIAMAWTALSARVSAVEIKVQQYPSQDYFELRFQTIEKSIDANNRLIRDLGEQLDDHNN